MGFPGSCRCDAARSIVTARLKTSVSLKFWNFIDPDSVDLAERSVGFQTPGDDMFRPRGRPCPRSCERLWDVDEAEECLRYVFSQQCLIDGQHALKIKSPIELLPDLAIRLQFRSKRGALAHA